MQCRDHHAAIRGVSNELACIIILDIASSMKNGEIL
jgi:hypothetical protein